MTPLSFQLLSIVLPFFITVSMIMVLKKVAGSIGLLDKPCDRKQHTGLVPLIGGIAMFIAFASSLFLLSPTLGNITILVVSGIVVVLGVLDDMHGLQTRKRFLFQVLAAVAMVYIGGTQLTQLGNLFGDGTVYLNGFFSLIFTVFCVVGVINAMNMMDGVDGLAGSISLMSFMALASIAYFAGELEVLLVILVIIGALLGFLLFNVHAFGVTARIFMGDAGSMMIGLLMAWLFIRLTQSPSNSLAAVSAGWFFGVPLLDTCVVMVKRVLHGQSPFRAGRDHTHHILLSKGFTGNQAVGILLLAQLFFIAGGFVANSDASWEPVMFWLFVALVIIHLFLTHNQCIQSQKETFSSTSVRNQNL